MKSLFGNSLARFGKGEKILIAISAVGLFATGGYFLFSTAPPRMISMKSNSFGIIKPMGQDVRVRGEQDENWNRVQRDANVFKNDRLYTGATSSALVSLKSKQKFTVEPNSLIVLSDRENTVDLNIGSGGFLGELKKGVKLLVQAGSTKTELQGDGGIVKLDAGGKNELKVVVLRGEAQVKDNQGQVQKITSENEVKITPTEFKVKKTEITLLSPIPGAIQWDQGKPVEFSWKINSAEAVVPVSIEISKDPLFKSEVKTLRVSDLNAKMTLSNDGVYFWRLSVNGKPEEMSLTSSFSYYGLHAPVIAKDTTIEIEGSSAGEVLNPISFAWNDSSLSESYEIQIAKDAVFSQILYSEKTSQGDIAIAHMRFGEYFWRVISRQETRKDLTSEVGHVLIKPKGDPFRKLAMAEPTEAAPPAPPVALVEKTIKQKPLERPQVLKEDYAFELIEGDVQGEVPAKGYVLAEKPVISWNPVEGAEFYELELSAYADFSEIQMKSVIKETHFVWEKPEVGQFFVRVHANRGSEISSEANVKLRTILMAPSLHPLQLSALPNQAPSLFASWKDHHLSAHTEIQISHEQSFIKPFIGKSSKGIFSEVLSEPGMYYVRVRSLNESNWPISRFSNVQQIEVSTWLPPEEILAKDEPAQPVIATPKFQIPRMGIWAGLGADYLVFKQAGAQDIQSGTFNSVPVPTVAIGANVRLSENSSFEFDYNDVPGKITVADGTQIDKTTYDWKTMVAEYQYRFYETDHSYYSVLVGVQDHQMPFLSVNGGGSVSLYENQLQNASLGFKMNYFADSNFEYEAFLRYQTLLSSKSMNGDTFNAHPSLMFDGSVGISRRFGNGFKAGLFWFGQYQDFKYDFTQNGTTNSGSQNFFNSNVQFRLGWEFYGFMTLFLVMPVNRRRRRFRFWKRLLKKKK